MAFDAPRCMRVYWAHSAAGDQRSLLVRAGRAMASAGSRRRTRAQAWATSSCGWRRRPTSSRRFGWSTGILVCSADDYRPLQQVLKPALKWLGKGGGDVVWRQVLPEHETMQASALSEEGTARAGRKRHSVACVKHIKRRFPLGYYSLGDGLVPTGARGVLRASLEHGARPAAVGGDGASFIQRRRSGRFRNRTQFEDHASISTRDCIC